MSGALRIDIVGGGIGGVTLGAALHRFGIAFQIFEQAPELKAIGYGLTLQKNALEALATIGLADAVRSRGVPVRQGLLRQPSGRTLTSAAVDLCAIHRATLLASLAEHVPVASLRLGQRLESATAADFTVAADGLHSVFRRQVASGEGPPRDSGYTAWRGLASRAPLSIAHCMPGQCRRRGDAGRDSASCLWTATRFTGLPLRRSSPLPTPKRRSAFCVRRSIAGTSRFERSSRRPRRIPSSSRESSTGYRFRAGMLVG